MADLKTSAEVRARIRKQSVEQISMFEIPVLLNRLAATSSKREFEALESLDQTRRFLVQLIDDCNTLEEDNAILRRRIKELGGHIE